MKEGFFIHREPRQGLGAETHVVPAPGGLAPGTHSWNYYSRHRADGNGRLSGPALQKGAVRLTAPLPSLCGTVHFPNPLRPVLPSGNVSLGTCLETGLESSCSPSYFTPTFFFLSRHAP